MSRPPGWRDRAATDLVLKHLDHLPVQGPVLIMEDPHGEEIAAALGPAGESATLWWRRVRGDRPASPWPPPASDNTVAGSVADTTVGYRAAFLRLPKSRDELEMAAHAAAHRLAPGAPLFVYGAKDEGAGSAAGRLEPIFESPWSVATGGRCRLVQALRPDRPAGGIDGLRAGLEAWRIETGPPHPDVAAATWVSYPGVFAAGRLDDGTALLLDHLPALPADARVLDFGCGDGVVSAVLAGRTPGLGPVMLDVDTVALAAAAENVPEGRVLPAEGMGSVGITPPFHAVVSNPPYHRGKAETVEVVRELVLGAATRLTPDGSLTMVVQRRLPVDTALSRGFHTVEVVADRGAFRVWRGTAPRG